MTLTDKEKLDAIEKIINEKAEEMDEPLEAKGTKLNQLPLEMKQSQYGKILKETVECFFDHVEYFDYELNKRYKKEITEHFDKLFKDPEFVRMINEANDEAPERYGT